MASINYESCIAKAKASPAFQKKMKEHADRVILHGGSVHKADGTQVYLQGIHAAVLKFIEVLKQEMESSGLAISNAVNLGEVGMQKVGDRYQVDISFEDNLHRESLVPSVYDGVDNIVALFNSGYSAGNTVYGIWHGRETQSVQMRPALHFIESAIARYQQDYAENYGSVSIHTDQAYQ